MVGEPQPAHAHQDEEMEAEIEGVEAPMIQSEVRAPRHQRRRREPSQARLEPTDRQDGLDARLTRIETTQAEIWVELRWMVETQRMMMLHMGVRNIPPFPLAGEDEAGPSGTHHDDME